MLEVRFHGRGGQGALTAVRILAAAFAKEKKDVLVIPDFRAERRSAPVSVSGRFDEEKVLLRSKVYAPDIIVVLDGSLIKIPEVQVLSGLKQNSLIVLNCADLFKFPELSGFKVGISDADAVAIKYKLGPASLPAVGTAMLGALVKVSGLLKLESVIEAASESDELPKKKENILAIKEVYEKTGLAYPVAGKTEAKQEQKENVQQRLKSLPPSVVSLGDTRSNKTGTWRKIKPEYSLPQDTISTCMVACPVHQDIREWLLAMKTGDMEKATKVILRHNPLASSVSRVCPVFCERGCRYFREGLDEPIAINAIERFLGDFILAAKGSMKPAEIKSDKKVAVVGSGPAGLTCAYILRNNGYAVTVFEKEQTFGGLLRWGIPDDRLPKYIVESQVDFIEKIGVELKSEYEITESHLEQLKKDFQAIFLAPGFSEGKKLNIPLTELEGVIPALDFLKKMNLGEMNNLKGKTVIVIGAGNTAMDSARTAKKLGAGRVIVAYRRKRENMKAFGNEIEETEKAGVQFNFEMVPLKIVRNVPQGLLAEFQNNNLKVILACDTLVMAVGQQKSVFFEKLLQEKSIEQLEKEGVFIGGDLLSGPKTVAHAIGTGNEGAKKILAFLEGKKYQRGKIRRLVRKEDIDFERFSPMPRSDDLDKFQTECQRCFTCGFCDKCGNCWISCPDMAISEQENGLKIDYDFCKGCQVCLQECPRSVTREAKDA